MNKLLFKREHAICFFLRTPVWDFKVWFLMYNYTVYTCGCNISIWLPIFYANCLIHLSLFELGNLEFISWTVGTGLFVFSCKKSVKSFFFGYVHKIILLKAITSTFVVKPELNLAYYSAYKWGKINLTVFAADSRVRKRGLMKWR